MGQEQHITFGFDGTLVERVSPLSPIMAPPKFVRLDNVSMGRTPGLPLKAPRFTSLGTRSTARQVGSLVRSNVRRPSTVYLGMPQTGQVEIEATDAPTSLPSPMDSTFRAQNAYWPVSVVDSGVSFSPLRVWEQAVCDNIMAAITYEYALTNVQLWVSFAGEAPRHVADLGTLLTLNDMAGLGITRHGDEGSYRLWYKLAGVIKCHALTVSGTTMTLGAANTVYTPAAGTYVSVAYASFGAAGEGDSNYAWMVTADSAVATTLKFLKVNINTYAIAASASFAAQIPNTEFYCALSHLRIGIVDYFAMSWSDSGGPGARCQVVSTTGTVVVAAGTFDGGVFGPVAAQWLATGAWVGTIYLSCRTAGAIGGTQTRTRFQFRQGPTMGSPGTIDDDFEMPWHMPHSRGTMWWRSATEVQPFFPMQALYDYGAAVTDPEFLEDPSYEIYTPQMHDATGKEFVLTSIARVGVDRAANAANWASTSNVHCSPEGRLRLLYLAEPEASARDQGRYGRFVEIDLTRGGRSVMDERGVGLIAAAQPAYCDGHEVVEWGPLHKPKVWADSVGGSGPALAAGDYAYRAVVLWYDAAGQVHRSAPSLPFTLTSPGGSHVLRVTIATTSRNGISQPDYEVEVYCNKDSDPSGYTLLTGGGTPMAPTSKSSNGHWYYDFVWAYDASSKALYSTGTSGQELLPAAPPPLWDIAIVGPRVWGIDAEDRSRAVHTKLKQDKVAHEFAGQEIRFASGVKLTAVAELDGLPLFLTSDGAFLVDGDGPNNTGYGQFPNPQRVSSHPCTQRDSVIRTPAGVFWANDARFVLWQSGGGARVFDELNVPANIDGATCFEGTNEVVWWAQGTAYVYNYAQDKWSRWESVVGADGFALVVKTGSSSGLALSCDDDTATATCYEVDLTQGHATLQAAWETAWWQPSGPLGDNTISEVNILCAYQGPHGVTVTTYTDFQTDAAHTSQMVLSAADVESARQGSLVYELRMWTATPNARAIKVVVQETGATGDGCAALACSVVIAPEPGLQRRYLSAGNK